MVVDYKPMAVENIGETNPVRKLMARYRKAVAIKDQWNPTFEDCYERGGFRALEDDEPMKLYDCPLMNFSGNGLNHIAVLCENNMLLHHPQGRLSCKEEYNRYYRSITGKIIRYVGLSS